MRLQDASTASFRDSMTSIPFFVDGYLTTLPIAQFALAWRQIVGSIESDVEIRVVEILLQTPRKTRTLEQQVPGGLQIRNGRATQLTNTLNASQRKLKTTCCIFRWTHSFCLIRIPTTDIYIYIHGRKQWQTTTKNSPRMQRTRAILVAWLGSGSCPN